jgi:N-ethylmaleimide reductase
MVTYYTQRASAGLIIAEMTNITRTAVAYLNTPSIETPEQMATWREVTDAVHAEGGQIVLQIAHGGRISHPALLDGKTPVAPSAIRPAGKTWTPEGELEFVTPQALGAEDILAIVADFRQAAANAKAAGFDGVEIHGANGYLVDQFLRSATNTRTDEWGGDPAARARFLMAVTQAAIEVWGPGRVGVRLSPFNPYNSMADADPFSTFPTAASLLDTLPLAYLHLTYGGGSPADRDRIAPLMRAAFRGPVIINGGYTAEHAEAALESGMAEAVAFGVQFLANPDLPARLEHGAELNAPDPSTFYMGTEVGYTDYPVLDVVVS